MQTDAVAATAAPIDVELGGRPYKLRPLTMAEWGRLQSWYKSAVRSPLERAVAAIKAARDRGEPFGEAIETVLLSHAQLETAAWPPRVGTLAWFVSVDSHPEGITKFLHAALSACNAIDECECQRLADTLTSEDISVVVAVAVTGALPDPKARYAPQGSGGGTGAPTPTIGGGSSDISPPSTGLAPSNSGA